MLSSSSTRVTEDPSERTGRRLLKGIAWFAGIGLLSLFGVLLLIVVMVGLALRSCSNIELGGSRTISGRSWCREQTAARPFLRTVNLAGVGGDAWPEAATDAFPPFELGRTTITGASEFNVDRQTIIRALRPGFLRAGDHAERRIEPTVLPRAQAAAARLDRYCDSHVGPPPSTTAITRP